MLRVYRSRSDTTDGRISRIIVLLAFRSTPKRISLWSRWYNWKNKIKRKTKLCSTSACTSQRDWWQKSFFRPTLVKAFHLPFQDKKKKIKEKETRLTSCVTFFAVSLFPFVRWKLDIFVFLFLYSLERKERDSPLYDCFDRNRACCGDTTPVRIVRDS